MYIVPNPNNKPDSAVQEVQIMLNAIRINYHHNWSYLGEDGRYGPQSASAVKQFQIWRNISSQTTPFGPVLGDYTVKCIRECYNTIPSISNRVSEVTPDTSRRINYVEASYNVMSTGVKNAYEAGTRVDQFTSFLIKTEEIILQQANNLQRRISKIPKNPRIRHLIKALEKSGEFIKTATKAGVNEAAKLTYGSLTKEDVIRYLKECSQIINNSPVTKFFTNAKNIMVKIKNAIKPLYDLLNKIPGLKYLGAIEKLAKGTWSMIRGEFENAAKLYTDALREIIESIIVDALVVAALALGGWVALVIAILVIIVAMIIDYFFFSDNPGDSLVDKHTTLKTRNLAQDGAGWAYHKINGI